jgi:hypothetical protein
MARFEGAFRMYYETREAFPAPGSVVSRPIKGTPYRHFAIVSDNERGGMPMLISFDPEGVNEIPWQWAGDGPWHNHGYWSDLPEWDVLARARNFVPYPYDLALRNCDFHVRYAHDLEPGSSQVSGTIVAIAVVALGCALLSSR